MTILLGMDLDPRIGKLETAEGLGWGWWCVCILCWKGTCLRELNLFAGLREPWWPAPKFGAEHGAVQHTFESAPTYWLRG